MCEKIKDQGLPNKWNKIAYRENKTISYFLSSSFSFFLIFSLPCYVNFHKSSYKEFTILSNFTRHFIFVNVLEFIWVCRQVILY